MSLADLSKEGVAASWIFVDCLPAQPMLEGASSFLEKVDVIVARVLLEQAAIPATRSSREELSQYLAPLSFRCIAVESERHPALARVLYVRDMQEMARKVRGEARRLGQRVEEARHAVEEIAAQSRTQISELEARLNKIIVEQEAGKKAAEESAARLEEQVEELHTELVHKDHDLATQDKVITEQKKRLAELREAKARAERLLEEKENETLTLAGLLGRARTELEASAETIRERNEELTRLSNEERKQADQIKRANEERDKKLRKEVQELRESIEAERGSWAEQEASLTEERDDAYETSRELRKEIEKVNGVLHTLKAESKQRTVRERALREELSRVQAQVASVEKLVLET